MSILTTAEVKSAYQRYRAAAPVAFGVKTASVVITEMVANSERSRQGGQVFDVFLSHSSKDAELVLGVKRLLEEQGRSVYIDWIDDPQLDRTKVTPDTADTLRKRMRSCKSLFFVDTTGSIGSSWMPWECGYFDALRNSRVAILPVRENAQSDYAGREFLGLYYYATIEYGNIWIHKNLGIFVTYSEWIAGNEPRKH